jgi:hypothetical protein
MNRRTLALSMVGAAALLAAITAFVGTSTTRADHRTAPHVGGLAVLATATPFALPANNPLTQDFVAHGFGQVERLGSHNGWSAFRVLKSDGSVCWAQGRSGQAWPFGDVDCPTGSFPSAGQPLIDDSIVEMTATDSAPHFIRVSGIAADGVSTVEALDGQGHVLLTLPVVSNIYSSGSTSLPEGAVTLQALAPDGTIVSSMP